MKISGLMLPAAAFVAAMMIAHPAFAQWPQQWPREREAPQHDRWRDREPRREAPRREAVCAPSGFATLRRNCSVDTGGCQRMPESCSYGWCCP